MVYGRYNQLVFMDVHGGYVMVSHDFFPHPVTILGEIHIPRSKRLASRYGPSFGSDDAPIAERHEGESPWAWENHGAFHGTVCC